MSVEQLKEEIELSQEQYLVSVLSMPIGQAFERLMPSVIAKVGGWDTARKISTSLAGEGFTKVRDKLQSIFPPDYLYSIYPLLYEVVAIHVGEMAGVTVQHYLEKVVSHSRWDILEVMLHPGGIDLLEASDAELYKQTRDEVCLLGIWVVITSIAKQEAMFNRMLEEERAAREEPFNSPFAKALDKAAEGDGE